jgi:four helix bundle protein
VNRGIGEPVKQGNRGSEGDQGMGEKIGSYKDLRVYQKAMDAAMKVFELTKTFPPEEKYSMVDQMRRASRSVCTNIGEAWRKRRYRAAFVAKLSDSESEACETQVWAEFARRCGYLSPGISDELDAIYDQIMGQLVKMIDDPDKWLIR